MNTQPMLETGTGVTWDGLLGNSGDNFETKSIVIEQRAAMTDAEVARGRLLNADVDGKYHPISSAETTVALNASGEVLVNDMAGTETQADVVLAHPPIPGTVTLATTADGSATHVVELGTDNGEGQGKGAGGHFTVDYETGIIHVVFTTAPTIHHDLKAGYKYRAVDAADSGETLLGMPKVILAEDLVGQDVIDGDVTTIAYVAGVFNRAALKGYSAGYESHLNRQGIYTK